MRKGENAKKVQNTLLFSTSFARIFFPNIYNFRSFLMELCQNYLTLAPCWVHWRKFCSKILLIASLSSGLAIFFGFVAGISTAWIIYLCKFLLLTCYFWATFYTRLSVYICRFGFSLRPSMVFSNILQLKSWTKKTKLFLQVQTQKIKADYQ